MKDYDDILYLPHPVSQRHPPMPVRERAAQFSAFAALSGHDQVLREAGRLTQSFIELTDSRKEELSDLLAELAKEELPLAQITYFVPDSRKQGGEYVTAAGRIRRVDGTLGRIWLEDGREIEIGYVLDICRGE